VVYMGCIKLFAPSLRCTGLSIYYQFSVLCRGVVTSAERGVAPGKRIRLLKHCVRKLKDFGRYICKHTKQ
jgi:hypothetical protein